MTAKEALSLMKNKSYVKWYDSRSDSFHYGRYIELLQIYHGRHPQDIGEPPRLITNARIRVSDICTVFVALKDLYPYSVSDDMIRNDYDKKLEAIGRAQRARLYKRCPRCGGKLADELVDNAVSKRDGRVLVCLLCGKTEAFCDENGIADPFTDWWCFLTEDEI